MNQIRRYHKNIRLSTPHLENERESNNKPFQGGNLFIHHINTQHKMIQMKRSPWYTPETNGYNYN